MFYLILLLSLNSNIKSAQQDCSKTTCQKENVKCKSFIFNLNSANDMQLIKKLWPTESISFAKRTYQINNSTTTEIDIHITFKQAKSLSEIEKTLTGSKIVFSNLQNYEYGFLPAIFMKL